jgi:hypothetical protein
MALNGDNEASAILAISRASLGAFGDRLCLRDPRAFSPRPALVPTVITGRSHLLIQRDFMIRYEYVVSRQQGETFQEMTKDPNAIHKTMNVVSGAMTVAKMLLPIEILLPFVCISSAKFRFRAPSFYGERTISTIWWRAEPENRARLEVSVTQGQQLIATGAITGAIAGAAHAPAISEAVVDKNQLARVGAFLQSLGVDSGFYFEKDGYRDYTYPVAYVAALPSGEMVKQFQGNGGMITSLLLDMSEQRKIPILSQKGPEVRLRLDRIRKAFSRIFADIFDGVITHVRGWAVVNPMAQFPYLNE